MYDRIHHVARAHPYDGDALHASMWDVPLDETDNRGRDDPSTRG